MLLINETTRKYSAVFSSLWLLFVALLPTFEALAITPPTDAEKSAVANLANQSGYANVNGTPLSFKKINSNETINVTPNSLQSLVNTTTAQQQQITGLGTQSPSSILTGFYRGSGRNGLDSITSVNQAGQNIPTCNSSEICQNNDKDCIQRVTSCKASVTSVTSAATDKEPQRAIAKQTRSTLSTMDPINVVGLNNLPEANSSICTTSSISLPQQTTTKQCIHGNFYKITGVKDSNVTILQEATPAVCEDGYALNTTTHLCEKVVIACPDGYYVYNGSCKKDAYCYDAAPKKTQSFASCPSGYFPTGSGDECIKLIYTCNPGDSLSGQTCTYSVSTAAQSAFSGYSCPSGGSLSTPCSTANCSFTNLVTCRYADGSTCPCGSSACAYSDPPMVANNTCSLTPVSTTLLNSSISNGIGVYNYSAVTKTCPDSNCYVPSSTIYQPATATYYCSSGTLSGTSCIVSTTGSCGYTLQVQCTKDGAPCNCGDSTCNGTIGPSVTSSSCPSGASLYNHTMTNNTIIGNLSLYSYSANYSGTSTVPASVAYSCSQGTLSGSTCAIYVPPSNYSGTATYTTACPNGGTLQGSVCVTNVSYPATPVTLYSNKTCSTGTKEVNTWWNISVDGPTQESSHTAGNIVYYTNMWGNFDTYYAPQNLLAGSYVWTWKFGLNNAASVTMNLDSAFIPEHVSLKIYINNNMVRVGDNITSYLVTGENIIRVESSVKQTTYYWGLKILATRDDTSTSAANTNYAQCSTSSFICNETDGGTLSGGKCCLPTLTKPLTQQTLTMPYTCSPNRVADPYLRCNGGDYLDPNSKKCYSLAEKTLLKSIMPGVQSERVTLVDVYEFYGSNNNQWRSDYFVPRDAAKGDGSSLNFSFVDNAHVKITGRMWSDGHFDTTTNDSNRVDFHKNGIPQGYLEFTMNNGIPQVRGYVSTTRFTMQGDGSSCITLSPGNKKFCFSYEYTNYSCPLGYFQTAGLPTACASKGYDAIQFCADTFQLTQMPDGSNLCVNAPAPNLTNNDCVTTYQTCPDGTFLNGGRCTGDNVMNKGEDCEVLPAPSGLPSGATPTETVYLCKVGVVDECATVDAAKCTLKTNTCIDSIMVPGSSSNGQCAMYQSTYDCTTAGINLSSTQCSFQPMCYNGTCFTPPGTQCEGKTVETTRTEKESCMVTKNVELRQCTLVETRDSQQKVIGYTAGSDCSNIATQGAAATCTQIPPIFNPTAPNGIYAPGRYPSKLTYSCLLPGVDECTSVSSKPGRTLAGSSCHEYQCLDPLPLDTMPIEQTGVNTTSIVGSVSNGAVPMPGVDLNTCSNKAACINEEKTYTYTVTSQSPGDECTTDMSQVLVSMEAARQAGNYIDPNAVKIFGGEFSRCDRRAASVLGANLGSKSCCNIDSPDPKSNAQLMGSPLMQGYSLLGSTVAAGSSYMYDYMMSSQRFVTAAQELWSAGALTDNMAQQGLNVAQSSAESLANFNFSPSVSIVPGFSIGYGSITGGGTSLIGSTSTVVNAAGTTATTTTTVAGVSTTTTTTAIGNTGFNFSYNPTMLYITAAMMAYQAYQAALACDEEDYKSSTKGKAKLCYDTGTWCEKKDCSLFGCTCVKYRTGKCCFNSKLARIINQQGRPQLGLDMRACDGFTVSQIQALDWSRIDLSEFIADMLAQAQQSTTSIMGNATQTALQNKLKGSAKTNAEVGTQPRLPVSQ